MSEGAALGDLSWMHPYQLLVLKAASDATLQEMLALPRVQSLQGLRASQPSSSHFHKGLVDQLYGSAGPLEGLDNTCEAADRHPQGYEHSYLRC